MFELRTLSKCKSTFHQDIPGIAFLCRSACKTQEVVVFAKCPEKSHGAQIRLTSQLTNIGNYKRDKKVSDTFIESKTMLILTVWLSILSKLFSFQGSVLSEGPALVAQAMRLRDWPIPWHLESLVYLTIRL